MTKKNSVLERLRAFPTVDGTPVLETFDLIEEAADEIERLNKIVGTAQLMRSAAVSYAGDTGHQVEGSWLWEKILDFEQSCLQSEPG